MSAEPAMHVADVVKHYRTPSRGEVHALDGVNITVERGEVLGIVGESGCGKSTLARLMTRLERPDSGSIELFGTRFDTARGRTLRDMRRMVQLVFQDPYASLDPRQRVDDAIGEVLRVHRATSAPNIRRRAGELLDLVGLPAQVLGRYPHELSGGQRQRIGIARALAVEPKLLVLDEPVSALDVSVRAEIMNLLARLRGELGLTFVFISHDLGMVRHLSDRIAVMYLGEIVEYGHWEQISDDPKHPYTRALQAAVPIADPHMDAPPAPHIVTGEIPDAAAPPSGCRFHPRCPLAEDVCRVEPPPLLEIALPPRPGPYRLACHVMQRELTQVGPRIQKAERSERGR